MYLNYPAVSCIISLNTEAPEEGPLADEISAHFRAVHVIF
jgi:hypothetical protein